MKSIKWIKGLALAICLAACSQRFEVNIPFALNRTDMRFGSSGNTYYVMVYSQGAWTAQLEKDVPWVQLSRTSGEGNGQILVSTDMNQGVSRGVVLTVRSEHGSREMYISQEGGLKDGGNYSLMKEKVDILRGAGTSRVSAGTNLDDETISHVQTSVEYDSEDNNWIHDIAVTGKKVTFRFDSNEGTDERSATVYLSFPLARWDKPVSAFFKVVQSVGEPAQIDGSIQPLPSGAVSWMDEDMIVILSDDGSSTVPAEIKEFDGASASFLYNKDALPGTIAGSVYPEDYVKHQNGGKVFLTLPTEQECVTELSKASQLAILAGKMSGEALSFKSACSILKLDIQGDGTLMKLSLSAPVPISGEGSVDLNAFTPVYVPDNGQSNDISVLLPEEGLPLPAQLYVAVPSGNLGRLSVNATTTSWSGGITCQAQSVGVVHEIVPLEQISLSIPTEAQDLCAAGKWANCYLVEDQSEKMYSIDLKKPDGKVPAEDITQCSYLWQTSPNTLTYLAIDVKGGKLYFRKGENLPGSALVGVMNEEGTVRWSWHIWAPATPVQECKFSTYSIMDRNLGAVEAAARDQSNASIGMHYQWGRKDPFPPSDGVRDGGAANHVKVYPNSIKMITAQDGVSSEVADANPTTYYWGSGATGKEDWLNVQDDTRWESGSSNANPCPPGWTVAHNAALELVAAKLKAGSYTAKEGITITDDEGREMLFVPGGWYRRSANTSSEIASCGDGRIWSSTPLEYGNYRGSWHLWFQSKQDNRRLDNNYPQRRWGANVRCVKIQ